MRGVIMLAGTNLGLLPFAAGAKDHGGSHCGGMVHGATGGETVTPYADLDYRTIASLSEEDVVRLRQGAGWDLALAAEPNGAPGPAHLLDLSEAIRATHAAMRPDAIVAGARLIEAEAWLDAGFRAGGLIDAAEVGPRRPPLRVPVAAPCDCPPANFGTTGDLQPPARLQDRHHGQGRRRAGSAAGGSNR